MESTEKNTQTQTPAVIGALHIDPPVVSRRAAVMDWLKRHGATAEVCFAGSGDSGDIVSSAILVAGKRLGLDGIGQDDVLLTFAADSEEIADAVRELADSVLEDYPDAVGVFNNEGGEVEIRMDPFGQSPNGTEPGVIELHSRFLTWHDAEMVRA